MEGRDVACVPGLAESRSPQIPVGTDLARHNPQVVPEVDDRGPPLGLATLDVIKSERLIERSAQLGASVPV
jgi:hypothetical protein